MKLLRALLALYCVEGLLTVLWISLTPSETGRALFLWFSRERLLLLLLAVLAWAAILGSAAALSRSQAWSDSVLTRIDHTCIEEKHLGAWLLTLSIPPLLLLAGALEVAGTPLQYAAYRNLAPDTFPLLHSLALAVLPLLLLGVLMALEFAIYLGVRYRHSLASPDMWAWGRVGPALLVLLIGTLTIFYWLVLIFQLRVFVNNPAWYWKFEPIAFHSGDLVFAVVALLFAGLTYWTLIRHRRTVAGLASLFALLLFLQFGVGLMSGGGIAAFRDRYFSTYHKTYLSKASQGTVSILESVRAYEQLYALRAFTNTKPPGLMAFYVGLDHLMNGHPSAYPADIRYERLSSLVTYLFPLLAALLPLALYVFANRFVQGRSDFVPLLAPFILALCPALILFSLFPDQAIYPLLFLLGASVSILTVQRQSLILAFLLGVFLFAAVFFAFTMLPLYPFAGLYLILNYWADRKERSLQRQLLLATAVAMGTLLSYIAFRLLLHYDFMPRFATTIAINHNFDFYLRVGRQPPVHPESLSTRIGQIVGAAWLNNLDFAAAMGFPVYLLFLVHAFRLLKRLWQGSANSGDLVLAAFLFSFIVLILAGTAQGEVPRLWLFWLPMVVMLAACELELWVRDHPRMMLVLAAVQLITLFLTFHFQDLHM